ncbi:MAG: hypothetical protein A2Y07_06730 [Planctomycetes bacterium GWF2_50_10]|nr:MAG: hypothetical protein A2Y07_06730 [Planctomycetes bacterium GWF2_50_10]
MPNSDDKCILFFVKDPSDGNVKTRLAAQIGTDEATELYKCFLSDLLGMLKEIAIRFEIVFYPPQSDVRIKEILGDSFSYIPQQGSDLGQRMKNAFLAAFNKGYKKVVIIGSDSPDLPVKFVKDAFVGLESHDAVIGPAVDGGYYLIGFNFKNFIPQAFDNIQWSTAGVFTQTVNILKKYTSEIHLLPQWYDIDTLDDLNLLNQRNTGYGDKS